MERKYRIYLHEISYAGENIGDDLSFTIALGGGTAITITPDKIGKKLKHGKTEKDFRALVHTGSTKEKAVEVEAVVKVLEVDKISDPGESKEKIKVDMEKPFGQTVNVTVEVKAKGGDAPRVGKFTLKFGIEPAFVVDGISKGEAIGNPAPPPVSTLEQINEQDKHIKQYDGETDFYVEYQIVLDGKGQLDTTKSVARFISISFSVAGEPGAKQPFQTFEMPITNVVFGADKSIVDSFKVKSDKWYTNLKRTLKDDGLTATIDIKNKKSEYEASYSSIRSGVKSTFKTSGDIINAPKNRPEPLREITEPVYLLGPDNE